MTEELTQCDCCDYFTIPEGQDYEICPVCFWEQDAFGITEPAEPSGANHGITLLQGRENYIVFGACEKQSISNVIPESERKKYRHVPRTIKF
ncbi:hypothetical protein HC024_21030 [Methylococcaceae bacterium WWC4]|nr:hypothetical protein [Methylococcaceae bacterium WWC4]